MFGTGSFDEIIATLRKNKLRTLLTGFSIAWGIFMLMVLLGMGNGLRNGMEGQLEDVADDYVSVYAGWTSRPSDGLPAGRRIAFDMRTYNFIRSNFPGTGNILFNTGKNVTFSYNGEYTEGYVAGANAELQYLTKITIKEGLGRFINRMDDAESRKVIVIHPNTQKVLFRNEDPIGKYITIDGIPFQVVGVYDNSDEFYSHDAPEYIPFTTADALYNPSHTYYSIEMSAPATKTAAGQSDFTLRLREGLARLHRFDPEDTSAVYIYNAAESVQTARQAFGLLNIFLGIIGLASMVAGIVGVGNIMYVTVRERTREIGIRKAIGASPASVIKLVIFEAIFITTVSGYAGILLGAGALKIVGTMISSGDDITSRIILNPSVNPAMVLTATLLLIICGVVAGFIPAWKAARIKPIEAMKAE